jgi:RNA polymerase sigma factor (sigma-70 family)
MASGPGETIQRDLERIYQQGSVAGRGEEQLLRQFVVAGDAIAFEALLARHGPMVLSVCRRILGDPHAAADAFQATFLVLVRKANRLRAADQLGPWLHGVAFRVAARARSDAARRRALELRGARAEAVEVEDARPAEQAELRGLLDREVDRLPESYRRAVILCYLEGQTHEEAARELGCTPGMLRGRLDRARAKLRARLARRGVAPALALGAATLLTKTAAAAVPAALRDATASVARQALAGNAAGAAVPASVLVLAQGVLRTALFSKLKVAVAIAAAAAVFLAVVPRVVTRDEKAPLPAAAAPPPRAEAGVAVNGRVLDRAGQPIAGARVGQGSNRQQGATPEVTTDAEGRFVFPGVAPGTVILTVQAAGHAPELKSVAARTEMEPLEFRLGPGRSIGGQIVDLEGKPIAGAPISAGFWRNHQSLVWHALTDADGRYRWDEAPEDEVLIDIGTLGYTSKRFLTFAPGQTDLVMRMPRPRFVRGSVSDAETGKPIETFTVLTGHAGDAGEDPEWEYANARAGERGAYEVKLDAGLRSFVRFVRIEADGYLPQRSRAFQEDEAEWDHHFDFTLRRGDGTIGGVVHLPGGLPLAGATVAFLTSRSPIIVNGQPPNPQFARLQTTGPDGRFRFPAPERPGTVVVLHDQGFAERTTEQLAVAGAGVLTIEPWGRIEGTYRIGSQPAAGKTLRLTTIAGGTPVATTTYGGHATTDAAGRFVFESVHPGSVAVARPVKRGRLTSLYPLSDPVTVAPGATARVMIGGSGRPVVGRASVPTALAGRVAWDLSEIVLLADEQSHRVRIGTLGPDGSFRIDDVPAGGYQLLIEASKKLADPNDFRLGEPPLAAARRAVRMPEIPGGRSDEPLDAGVIALEPEESP